MCRHPPGWPHPVGGGAAAACWLLVAPLETQLECRVRAPPKVVPYGGCQRMSHNAHALYLLACLLVNKPLRCIVLLGLPCSFLPQACTRQYQYQMRTLRVWLKPRPAVPSLRSCSPSTPPPALLHRRLDSQSRRKETGGRIVVAAHTFCNLYAYHLLSIASTSSGQLILITLRFGTNQLQ